MSAPDLAERIQRVEDRFAIIDLAVRYCVAMDDGDYDALVDMYTDQATLGSVVGARQVVDTLASIRRHYGRTIHVPEAHTITFADNDHASGIVLSHAELDIRASTVHTYIRYYDRYERGTDGAWRFADRALKFAYALPFTEMAESLTADDAVRWPGTAPAAADRF